MYLKKSRNRKPREPAVQQWWRVSFSILVLCSLAPQGEDRDGETRKQSTAPLEIKRAHPRCDIIPIGYCDSFSVSGSGIEKKKVQRSFESQQRFNRMMMMMHLAAEEEDG